MAPVDERIEVAYARPDLQRVVELTLPAEGMTALEAVERSGLLREFPEVGAHPLVLGIYGAVCEPTQRLRAGDRVEIYRHLRHDPRALRRERAAGSVTRKGRKR